jgi:hypothetical protein
LKEASLCLACRLPGTELLLPAIWRTTCLARTLASTGPRRFEIVVIRGVPVKGNPGFIHHKKRVRGGCGVFRAHRLHGIISFVIN